jgi:hypothetical protein
MMAEAELDRQTRNLISRHTFTPVKSFERTVARMDQAQRLRDLATWYREFAERTENPAIWDSRLRTAEDLEREAEALESRYERERRLAS